MVDYVQKLRDDLVEQFRDKPAIDTLMEAIGSELNELRQFYDDLREKRSINTAVGKQLDGIGDNAVLTRLEAGALACVKESVYVLNDDDYRTYLIYKIWKNTCNCTYQDIVTAFKMFWDKPLYYREDTSYPATMIFDTGEIDGFVDTSPLFTIPLLRAAGVTLKLYARTRTSFAPCSLSIASGLGYAATETCLPTVERVYDFKTRIGLDSGMQSVLQSELPLVE